MARLLRQEQPNSTSRRFNATTVNAVTAGSSNVTSSRGSCSSMAPSATSGAISNERPIA